MPTVPRNRRVQTEINGPLRLVVDGEDVTPTARRERRILALLAVHRRVSVNRIFDILWIDPPKAATNSVHVSVSRLRRVMGAPSIEFSTPYFSLPKFVTVDYDTFRVECRSPDPAVWERLLGSTSRDVLDDLIDDLDLAAHSNIIQRDCIDLTARLAAHYLEVGRPFDALNLIERDLLADPSNARLSQIAAEGQRQIRSHEA